MPRINIENFETLDISGDIGIRAFGKDLQKAFINTALGMYNLITDLDKIEERSTVEFSVEDSTLEGLLVSWLNELIFHFDTYGFIGKKITITEITPCIISEKVVSGSNHQYPDLQPCRLKAYISGEEFDLERHERGILIKAATYHKLKMKRKNDLWEIEVVFDI